MGGQKPFSKRWKFFPGIGKIAKNIRKKKEGKKARYRELTAMDKRALGSAREMAPDVCVWHSAVLHITLCYTIPCVTHHIIT